eukprot:jgi/Ulvmu1/10028/UM059_0077.1
MAAFYSVVAHSYIKRLEGTDATAPDINKAMQVLKRASQAIARLQGPAYQAIRSALVRLVQEGRATLDTIATLQQQACCAAAVLPPLSHEDMMQQLRPFEVSFPHQVATAAGPDKGIDRAAVANLAPISEPPERTDVSTLWVWVRQLKESGFNHQQLMQMLHEIEQCFFQHGASFADPLTEGPSDTALDEARLLAEFYFQQVQQYEKKHLGHHNSDMHTDVLKVELRSRETLVTWVMLCLAHRRAAVEFPGLQAYALPVQPDDLRHLVLRDRRAMQVAQAVAAYISAVNCNASKGRVFSTKKDATGQLATEFAASSPVLQQKLSEEEELAARRVEAHWQKIQKMQDHVRDLERQLEEAKQELAQKELAEAKALADLESAIKRATPPRNAAKAQFDAHVATQEASILHLQESVRCWVESSRRYKKCLRQEARAKYQASATYMNLMHEHEAADKELNSLIADKTRDSPHTQPGRVYGMAKQAVRQAKQKVHHLNEQLAAAKVPPTHVYHPLPSPVTHSSTCQALLFFLYPQHTHSFPLLRQYCCAAQQCIVPLAASGAPQTPTHAGSHARTASWVDFYNRLQKSCAYVSQPWRQGQCEDSTQLIMFRCQSAPAQKDYGPSNVMNFTSPDVGVWWPDGDLALRLWQGGPTARYISSNFIDPFAAQDSAAVAASYTEPGKYHSWLQVCPANECSRLCFQSGACGDSCCGKHTFCDASAPVEAARGNRVLAEQQDRPGDPHSMTMEQWRAFASLRAYPLQQRRALFMALHEGRVPLESPQMAAAVRLALYHVGQLQLQQDGGCEGDVRRFWEDDGRETEALCEEMQRQAALMEPAPKLLLQGPLICEIASFLAQTSQQGTEVARRFMAVAGNWARQIQEEISDLHTAPPQDVKDVSLLHSRLQTKCAIAHCCAVLCFGCAPFVRGLGTQGGAQMGQATMDLHDAAALLFHRVQAYLHAFHDSSNALQGRLTVLTKQCAHVMTHQVHSLNSAVVEDHSLLDRAVRSVFADLPQHVVWQKSEGHLGCYVAHAHGQVYSINMLTGCVLCNGLAPGHLPAPIVEHADYQRIFGNAKFEVTQLKGEQQGKFRTVQQHGGHIYTFMLRDSSLLVQECPCDADSGEMQLDLELELLSGVQYRVSVNNCSVHVEVTVHESS